MMINESNIKLNINEWEKFKITKVDNFLNIDSNKTANNLLNEIRKEINMLYPFSENIFLNPHSKYKQLMPEFMLNNNKKKYFNKNNISSLCNLYNDWSIMSLYYLPELLEFIKKVTQWKHVCRLPILSSREFEINGKINFYNADYPSFLDWHFDKVYNYLGNQVVCVFTVKNDLDALMPTDRPPTLEVSYMAPNIDEYRKKMYLGSNSISLHDPNSVFHRVLPFQRPSLLNALSNKPCSRTVFIMRFTNDPTPSTQLYKTLGKINYVKNNAVAFVRVGDIKWLTIVSIFIVFLCICAGLSVKLIINIKKIKKINN